MKLLVACLALFVHVSLAQNSVVAVGSGHTCIATVVANEMRCWGFGQYGQLGAGSVANIGMAAQNKMSLLGPISFKPTLGTVAGVAAGDLHTCALFDTGKLACFGLGNRGQIGLDSSTTRVGCGGTCLATLSLSGIGFADPTALVSAVTTGSAHSCALFTNGKVKCWGSGGRLGLNTATNMGVSPGDMLALPYLTFRDDTIAVTAISAGLEHTCALFVNGRIFCWGLASQGQLGQNSMSSIGHAAGTMTTFDFISFSSVEAASKVSCGYLHTCAMFSGKIRCWGSNSNGQLGVGTTAVVGNEVNEMSVLAYLSFSDGFLATDLTAGMYHTCALFSNKKIRCWGRGEEGALGNGATAMVSTVNNLGYLSFSTATDPISLAQGSNAMHACALFANGKVRCWGHNFTGQLGQEDFDNYGSSAASSTAMLPFIRLP